MTKTLSITGMPSSFAKAALFTMLLTVSSAFGTEIKANIPFEFHVGAKTLPAGDYEFNIDRGKDAVIVKGGKPRTGADVLIVTTMAVRPYSKEEGQAHIVFDEVGAKYTLSELWEPGGEGTLVFATKGKHEHHVIHVPRK